MCIMHHSKITGAARSVTLYSDWGTGHSRGTGCFVNERESPTNPPPLGRISWLMAMARVYCHNGVPSD